MSSKSTINERKQIIREGKICDFKFLDQDWAWADVQWQREAQKKTIDGIKAGKQTFYVVENEKHELIGELHVYWNIEDKDEANGKNRAYLSAMRMHPDYRSKGLGTKLMKHCLKKIKECGFNEVTIGAYVDEPKTQELYKRWGFTEFVKEGYEITSEYKAKYYLYLQKL